MSLMHAHIRSQRAMADALESEADHLKLEAPADNNLVCRTLRAIAAAYRMAADTLEREEKALLEHVGRIDRDTIAREASGEGHV